MRKSSFKLPKHGGIGHFQVDDQVHLRVINGVDYLGPKKSGQLLKVILDVCVEKIPCFCKAFKLLQKPEMSPVLTRLNAGIK